MSYVEHGSRVFLAGRDSNGMLPNYSDYVFPRKRTEGRLKVYESCLDIRAWSSNLLENAKYFRELAEHSMTSGKIVPLDVVIDNIIVLGSKTQDKLQRVARELEKYKTLKLTHEQELHLENFDSVNKHQNKIEGSTEQEHLSGAGIIFKAIGKSVSTTYSESYLPIALHSDSSLLYQEIPYQHILSEGCADCCGGPLNCIEYSDVCLQATCETCDIEVQTDNLYNEDVSSKPTIFSVSSDISSEKYSSTTEGSHTYSYSRKHKKDIFGIDRFPQKDSNDTESESRSDSEMDMELNFEMCEVAYKRTIIKKDSEIIALKHELSAKDAELDEYYVLNKNIEELLKQREEDVNILRGNVNVQQEKMDKITAQNSEEVDDLKEQLSNCKSIVEKLKEDCTKQCEISCSQMQEIERFRSHAAEAATLRIENDSFKKKIKDLESQATENELHILALERLQNVVHEKDALLKENHEQRCILADHEDEIKQLLILIKQIEAEYNNYQIRMKAVVDSMKTEINDKDERISEYDEQFSCIKEEINELTVNLKYSLNDTDSLSFVFDKDDNIECEKNVCFSAKDAVFNLRSLLTLAAQQYKLEHDQLLNQVVEIERHTHNNHTSCSDSSSSGSGQNLDVSKGLQSHPTEYNTCNILPHTRIGFDNNGQLLQKVVSEEFFGAENLLNDTFIDLNPGKIRNGHGDELDKIIAHHTSNSLIKIKCLTDQLQMYIEKERPSIIQFIDSLQDNLKNVELLINQSEDAIMLKQILRNFCNEKIQALEKFKSSVSDWSNEMYKFQITSNDSSQQFLYWQYANVVPQDFVIYDKQVDQVLVLHVQYAKEKMDRIHMAFQDAKNRYIAIENKITTKEQEIQRRDIEIALLKKKVASGILQIGGDYVNNADMTEDHVVEEKLLSIAIENNEKSNLITQSRESQDAIRLEFSSYMKELDLIKTENNELLEIRMNLQNENDIKDKILQVKNNEIQRLIQQVEKLQESLNLEGDIKKNILEMKKKLDNLQEENETLRKQLQEANSATSKNCKDIVLLKDQAECNEQTLTSKITECNINIARKLSEIKLLKRDNTVLKKQCDDMENELQQKKEEILCLRESNDEVDAIHTVQQNIYKQEERKKSLETKIDKKKVEFHKNQNTNIEFERKLNSVLESNEELQRNIHTIKQEYVRQTSLFDEMMTKATLKDMLYERMKQLHQKIIFLKNEACAYENKPVSQLKELNNEYKHNFRIANNERQKICDNEKVSQDNKSILVIKQEHHELKAELHHKNKQFNDTFIDLMEMKHERPRDNNNKNVYDSADIKCELKCLESDNKHEQAEIQRLTCEIESTNSKMKHLKDDNNKLLSDLNELQAKLNRQMEEYENKLKVLKRKYDSGVESIRERHKESLERMQKVFEDIMEGKRNPFDAKIWLKSLSQKELTELHNQIYVMLTSCLEVTNEQTSTSNNQVTKYHQQLVNAPALCDDLIFNWKDKCQRKEMDLREEEQEVTQELQYEPQKLPNLPRLAERYCGTELQIMNKCQEIDVQSDTNTYLEDLYSQGSHIFSNYPEYQNEEQPEELQSTEWSKLTEMRKNKLNCQRKIFIAQCSIQHKLGNPS